MLRSVTESQPKTKARLVVAAVSSLVTVLVKLIAVKEVTRIVSIVIYVKPNCPYCQQARDYYNESHIPFVEYDAQNDRARRKEMFAYSDGDPTVPCIVENGVYVGSGWGNPPRG